MFQIRRAKPQDAMSMALVNVYTWRTTYSGLMPDELIQRRILNIVPAAKRMRQQLEKEDHCFGGRWRGGFLHDISFKK